MAEKIIKTILTVVSITSAILLWVTREEWLPSLSAFALSTNVLWYRTMHISAIIFCTIDGARRKSSYFLAFGMSLILIFDMYHHTLIHNIATASTLLLACILLLVENKGFERIVMVPIVLSAVLFFSVGYFNSTFHFLMAEILALGCIYIGKLREIWN
jgi:hypothetical protein